MRINICELSKCDEDVGGKGRALILAESCGVHIPPTVVVPATELNSVLNKSNAGYSISKFMQDHQYNPEVAVSILNIISRCNIEIYPTDIVSSINFPVIARSSACVPDGAAASISGAFRSYECLDEISIGQSVAKVWASAFSREAHMQSQFIRSDKRASGMAVLIQPQLEADISGVAQIIANKSDNSIRIDLSWVKGHLAGLVGGKETGVQVNLQHTEDQGIMVIGQELSIQKSLELNMEMTFERLFKSSSKLFSVFKCNLEVEWLINNGDMWVLQAQRL